VRRQTTAKAEADPYGMTNKKTDNSKNKNNGMGWMGKVYIPTHRDGTAMDGAPEPLWRGK
jgi:hypothetical protein